MEDRPRPRPGSILLSLILLSPLLWAPGYGFDGVRRPLVIGMASLMLGGAALRGLRVRRGRDPVLRAALVLGAVQALSLAGATTVSESFVPMAVLFSGVALYGALRGGAVDRDFARDGAPLVVSMAGLGAGALGIFFPSISPEGNPNYTGALAGMLLPATAAFALSGRGFVKRGLPALSALTLLADLLISQSRGGWAGAVAGLGVTVAAAAVKRLPGWKVLAGGLLVVGILPFVLPGSRMRSEAGAEGVSYRLEAWKSSVRMTADRPLLGVGPGNFTVEYPRYRSEAEFRGSTAHSGGRFVEAEDAHSSWVQAAVETGLPGLAAFAALAFCVAWKGVRTLRSSVDPGTSALLAGLGGGAAAYFVSGLFNTLTTHVSPSIAFWAFAGLIEVLGGPEEAPAPVDGGRRPLALLGSVAGLLGALWAGAWAYADWAFTRGMATVDPEARAAAMRRSLGAQPGSARAHLELARALAAGGNPEGAIEPGRRSLELRPHSVPALNNVAVWMLAAKRDPAEAEQLLRHASEVAPYYFLSHFNLGLLRMQKKDWSGAREEFARAAAGNPRHGPSISALGECLAREGRMEEAVGEFRKARAAGIDVGAVLRQDHPELARDPRLAEFMR